MPKRPPLIHELLTPPLNYREEDADLLNFQDSVCYPPPTTQTLYNVRYEGHGIIHKLCMIYAESFNDYWSPSPIMRAAMWPKPWRYYRFFRRHYLGDPLQVKLDKAWLFSCNFAPGYYHWLIECLPRFILGEECGFEGTVLIPDDTWSPFIKDTLNVLGIQNFCIVKQDHYAQVGRLDIPLKLSEGGSVNPLYLKKLRERFLKAVGVSESKRNRRIYISRSKAKKRRLLNENAIVELLKKHGFEVVCLEDFSMREAVILFNDAQCVVGQHGAGLANMLFMPIDSPILEIGMRTSFYTYYLRLAHALNLPYYYSLDAIAADREAKTEIIHQDAMIDVDAFEATLMQMLERASY
jgi:capsular polysaccharide biosynthesis protein